jgi:hypothetical protein
MLQVADQVLFGEKTDEEVIKQKVITAGSFSK